VAAPWPRQKEPSPPCSITTSDTHARRPLPVSRLIRRSAVTRADHEDRPAEQQKAVSRLVNYYLYAADKADRLLQSVPAPDEGLGHRSAGPVVQRSAAERTRHLAGPGVAQRPARRAVPGRQEWRRQCADLIHVLAGFVEIRGHWHEAIAAHTLALQACRDIGDPVRVAQASLELSVVSLQTGRQEAAIELAEEAQRSAARRQTSAASGEALDQIGLANQRAGRSSEALAYFREARILYSEVDDPHGNGQHVEYAGIACWHLGRYPDAMGHLREALSLYRDRGDPRGEAKTLNNLGKMQATLWLSTAKRSTAFTRHWTSSAIGGGRTRRSCIFRDYSGS